MSIRARFNSWYANEQYKLALDSDDWAARLLAVERITKQSVLAEIAREDPSEEVRTTAVEQITSQATLTELIRSGTSEEVVEIAIASSTDTELLRRYAAEYAAPEAAPEYAAAPRVGLNRAEQLRSIAALERLQALEPALAPDDIVENRPAPMVSDFVMVDFTPRPLLTPEQLEARHEAALDESITATIEHDSLAETIQKDIADTALNDPNWGARLLAVEKLENQQLLAEIAVHDDSQEVRTTAAERLTDQTILAELAVEDESISVRAAAAEQLEDIQILADLTAEFENETVSQAASHRLDELAAQVDEVLAPEVEALDAVVDQALTQPTLDEMLATLRKSEQIVSKSATLSPEALACHLNELARCEGREILATTDPNSPEHLAAAESVKGLTEDYQVLTGRVDDPEKAAELLAASAARVEAERESAIQTEHALVEYRTSVVRPILDNPSDLDIKLGVRQGPERNTVSREDADNLIRAEELRKRMGLERGENAFEAGELSPELEAERDSLALRLGLLAEPTYEQGQALSL